MFPITKSTNCVKEKLLQMKFILGNFWNSFLPSKSIKLGQVQSPTRSEVVLTYISEQLQNCSVSAKVRIQINRNYGACDGGIQQRNIIHPTTAEIPPRFCSRSKIGIKSLLFLYKKKIGNNGIQNNQQLYQLEIKKSLDFLLG